MNGSWCCKLSMGSICRWRGEFYPHFARGVIVVTIYLAESSKLDTALNMYYHAVYCAKHHCRVVFDSSIQAGACRHMNGIPQQPANFEQQANFEPNHRSIAIAQQNISTSELLLVKLPLPSHHHASMDDYHDRALPTACLGHQYIFSQSMGFPGRLEPCLFSKSSSCDKFGFG